MIELSRKRQGDYLDPGTERSIKLTGWKAVVATWTGLSLLGLFVNAINYGVYLGISSLF